MPDQAISTVFVVDDEPVIATTLAAIFNLSGFQANAFIDGETALRAVESECPNLLISDVVMPGGMNGLELATRCKSIYPNCNVLLFSGNISTHDLLITAAEHGLAFDVIAKPVHPPDLLDRSRRL